MEIVHGDQFLGLPPCPPEKADVVLVPLPLERTVSYGTGTWRAPRAILEASCQVEFFDEQTGVDLSESPRVHTLPALVVHGEVEDYLAATRDAVRGFRDKFVVGLGGEHLVTYGLLDGLVDDLADVTLVQIDAHADLIDELDGRRWSHGTVMRRLWQRGCRLVQIGVRSLCREEYDLATGDARIDAYFAHQLPQRWPELLETLRRIEGRVYLTIDVDGLDPSVIPNTGTPQPDGLSWRQTIEIIRALATETRGPLIGADIVELIASPHPPGCDIIAARLLTKLLAFWAVGKRLREER